MIFINADPHGDYTKISNFISKMKLTNEDTIVLLGDVAANYFADYRDTPRKQFLNNLGPKFFCIQGNHELRPHHIESYKLEEHFGAPVWVDDAFPNLLFAKDGEIYNFDGKQCLVLGGAYSVDKEYRLTYGYRWFEDEQPSEEIKKYAEQNLEKHNYKVDYVFSHTSPISYEPRECFLPGIDQTKVDKTTELWLETIENKLQYDKWFIGHYHIDKSIDKIQFLFNGFERLQTHDIEHDFDVFDNLNDEPEL